MQQIFLDTLGCVKFTEYSKNSDTGKDYIFISPAIDGLVVRHSLQIRNQTHVTLVTLKYMDCQVS